ncbi:hypothetical protein PIB30_084100, partial [Stylosanthes scabra]|nr:hypothetical protein [Stylosanthes scabra]
MLIVYLHETHFGEYSEDDEARPPGISYWREDRLKERLKLEKKDSTGLLSQAKQRNRGSRGDKCRRRVDQQRIERNTRLVVETTIEKDDAAEEESVIEVVEATSAEEELIRRDLSES